MLVDDRTLELDERIVVLLLETCTDNARLDKEEA